MQDGTEMAYRLRDLLGPGADKVDVELIHGLERCGLRALPVFINGVEAHTVVRDAFTSDALLRRRAHCWLCPRASWRRNVFRACARCPSGSVVNSEQSMDRAAAGVRRRPKKTPTLEAR